MKTLKLTFDSHQHQIPKRGFRTCCDPEWWYDIVEGLPNPTVKNGYIDVWDKPGLGITFNIRAAKAHLSEEDRTFFD